MNRFAQKGCLIGMNAYQEDREVLRNLAAQYREIAHLQVQQTNIANWKRLYARKDTKPMLAIDQICWGELNGEEELKCVCQDPFARELESQLRVMLYRWKHFPCDMVFSPYFRLDKRSTNSGIGVETVTQNEEHHENAQSHLYVDNIPDEAALEKLHAPVIRYDREASEQRKQRAEEYFGDILPVRLVGTLLWEAIWDRITFTRGAETVLYDLLDRPEFLHDLMKKMVEIDLKAIDQYESENLLEAEGALCHCVETYSDDLPKPGFDPNHVRAMDCWASGAAQIFSEVSPAMHDEFEIEYMKPIYARFGLVNYGCCEPLHNKIDIIRKLPNVRTISASPWANVEIESEAMGSDFVMARKPNPAFVAFDSMDETAIRREIRATLNACRKNNTPVVFVLKDITTIRNQPKRLDLWYNIAKSEIEKDF